MDPVMALATTAVAAIAPYLAKAGEKFAEEAGKAAAGKIGALYQFLKTRFEKKPGAPEVFKYLEANPSGEDAQAAMRVQLAMQLMNDKEFEESLRKMLEEIKHDPASQSFITNVYGGEVGQIINADRIDSITFNKEAKKN